MPNHCSFEMRVVGDPHDIAEFEKVACDYGHRPHFWRVFELCETEREEAWGLACVEYEGQCAWSVRACMCDRPHTYADDFRDGHPGECTSLAEQAERLHLEIEVRSTEPGCGFAEHMLYRPGEKPVEESRDYCEWWWDASERGFEEWRADIGLPASLTEGQLSEGGTFAVGAYAGPWRARLQEPEIREFYQVEEEAGRKLVHYMGWLWTSPEGARYRTTELTFCYAEAPERPDADFPETLMLEAEQVHQYEAFLDERTYEAYMRSYFGEGEEVAHLELSRVSQETEPGFYWSS